KHRARNVQLAKRMEALAHFRLGKALEVGEFGAAKYLDAFPGKITVESGESKARSIDGGLADLSIHAGLRSNQFQMQHLTMREHKVADGDAGRSAAGRTRFHATGPYNTLPGSARPKLCRPHKDGIEALELDGRRHGRWIDQFKGI